MIKKEELRKIFKEKRLILSKSEVKNLSNSFFNFFAKNIFLDFRNKTVSGYYSFNNELDIFISLKYLKDNYNCNICLPIVKEKNQPLIFREFSFKENLGLCKFLKNLKEPTNSSKELIPKILLIPALAVDITGNRVGYGKGYYDRTLKELKNKISIATVYDFQIIDKEIESDIYDEKVDYIISEKRIIKISK